MKQKGSVFNDFNTSMLAEILAFMGKVKIFEAEKSERRKGRYKKKRL